MARDIFMERCMHNPSLRDRLPILTHSLAHKKKVYIHVHVLHSLHIMYTHCVLECVYIHVPTFYSVLVHSTMLMWRSSSSLMRISPLTQWYIYVSHMAHVLHSTVCTVCTQEGDIWPNSQAEISIIFTPSESIR